MDPQSAEKETPRLRVAIIGAGIGGLTLSAALGALSKYNDLEIDIYESAALISEIGAGITLWPRFFAIMNSIDLGKPLSQFLQRQPDDSDRLVFQLRKADQKEGVFIHDIIMKGGSTTFHRADLQQTLVSRMYGTLHLGHRLCSLEEKEDHVVMNFKNGNTATCDLLIGMDGIKSTVRKSLLTKLGLPNSPSINPVWSGTVAYRGVVPRDTVDALFPGHRTITTPMMYLGKSKHVVAYAISRNLINVAAFVTDPEKEGTEYDDTPAPPEALQKELVSTFTDWEPELKILIESLKQPLKWPINQLVPMERYASGRIIIAGDAAHGMPPHQGTGASVAIEDAYILANLLCDKLCTKENILKVSDIYNELRCPAGNMALEETVAMGKKLDLFYPGLEKIKEGDECVDHTILESMGRDVSQRWEWVWNQSAEDGKVRALEMLKSLSA